MGLVVVGGDDQRNAQLWWVNAARQERRRITNDLLDYRKGSLTSDGKSLVAVVSDATAAIWVAAIDGKSEPARVSTGRYDGISGVSAVRGGRMDFLRTRQPSRRRTIVRRSAGSTRITLQRSQRIHIGISSGEPSGHGRQYCGAGSDLSFAAAGFGEERDSAERS